MGLLLGIWRCLRGSAVAVAIPVSSVVTLGGLDVAYHGEPFCYGPINVADSGLTLDYVQHGEPFTTVIT